MTDLLDTRPDITASTHSPLDDARSQLADAIKVLGYDQGMYDLFAARAASSPSASRCAATTARSRSSPATASSTTTPAARPRAACASARTSTSTRSARWRCG